jgi:hypothetical protein
MMYPYVLCVVIILLCITQCYLLNQKECMSNLDSKKPIDLLNDDLFSDVKMYANDDTDDINQKLGITKCIADPKCETCVEFGISGSAFCFPKLNLS